MKLYGAQVEGLKRSNGARGFGYFMEMGLGKTLLSEVDFTERVAEGNADRSIVFAPNSFKSGWVADAEKHGIPVDQFIFDSKSNYHSSWANRASNQPKQLIINYEAIRSAATMQFLKGFCQGRKVFGIFDESIQISTHDAAQTKAAIEISKELTYSRLLSGKPIKQGPHDLWSQMRAIGQLNGRNYFAFKTTFCRMGGFKMKQVMGAQNEDFLGQLIDPHVFRATKAEWLPDLPPKLYTTREYTMSPEMKAMYDSMLHDFVLWLNEQEVVAVDAAITKMIKLAQIQTGWIYDEGGEVRQLVPDDRNPRLKLLLSTIENETEGKVAIPYNHRPVFDQLLRNLGGPEKVAWIKGQMTPAETDEQKRRFNEDPNVRYILLQTRASKYGHTLLGIPEPGHRCYTMIPYENTYSLDDRSQIEDRVHRIGQDAEKVLYIDLVGTPLDRDCVNALQRKEDIFQAVMAHLR